MSKSFTHLKSPQSLAAFCNHFPEDFLQISSEEEMTKVLQRILSDRNNKSSLKTPEEAKPFIYFEIFKYLRLQDDYRADYYFELAHENDTEKDNPKNPRAYYYTKSLGDKISNRPTFFIAAFDSYVEISLANQGLYSLLSSIKAVIISSESFEEMLKRLKSLKNKNVKELAKFIEAQEKWVELCKYAKDFKSEKAEFQELLGYLRKKAILDSPAMRDCEDALASKNLEPENLKEIFRLLKLAEKSYQAIEAVFSGEAEPRQKVVASDLTPNRLTSALAIYYSGFIDPEGFIDPTNGAWSVFYFMKSIVEAHPQTLYRFYKEYNHYVSDQNPESVKEIITDGLFEELLKKYRDICKNPPFYFLESSAMRGCREAQYDLAGEYRKINPKTEINQKRSEYFLNLAAQNGLKEAQERLPIYNLINSKNFLTDLKNDDLKISILLGQDKDDKKEEKYRLSCKIFDTLVVVKKSGAIKEVFNHAKEYIKYCAQKGDDNEAKLKFGLILSQENLSPESKIEAFILIADALVCDHSILPDKIIETKLVALLTDAGHEISKKITTQTVRNLCEIEFKAGTKYQIIILALRVSKETGDKSLKEESFNKLLSLASSDSLKHPPSRLELISNFIDGEYIPDLKIIKLFQKWPESRATSLDLAKKICELGSKIEDQKLQKEYKNEFLQYAKLLDAEALASLEKDYPSFIKNELVVVAPPTKDVEKDSIDDERRKSMREFLVKPCFIGSIAALPEFLANPLRNLLTKEYEVGLKGSVTYQATKAARPPSDLDIDVRKVGSSSWSDEEITKFFQDNFGINGKINIFRSRDGSQFTAKFDDSIGIDVSLYDPEKPSSSRLEWNTTVDAKRIRFNPDGSAERYNLAGSADKFRINPQSHKFMLRCCFLATIGNVSMENVELAAREIGLGSGAILLTTELKITPHQLTAQNFSAGIEEYMSSHKLSEPLKLDFLNNLEKIAQLGFRELYREDVAQRDLVIRAIKEMIASQSKSPDSSPKITAAPAPAITSSGAGVVIN